MVYISLVELITLVYPHAVSKVQSQTDPTRLNAHAPFI